MPPSTTHDPGIDHVWDDYIANGRPVGGHHEDLLARHYLPYATRVGERIHRTVGDAVERDEIMSSAFLGLLEAIRRYDPTQSAFQTYATRKIKWKVSDGLRGGDWLPRRRRDNLKAVQAAAAILQQRHQSTPSDTDIASQSGLTVKAVRVAYEDYFASKVYSLNDLASTEDGTGDEAINRIHERSDTPVEDAALRSALHGPLYEAIKVLPRRDRQIIALYHLEKLTLEEIGKVFGVSYSRISQLLTKATLVLFVSIEGDPT